MEESLSSCNPVYLLFVSANCIIAIKEEGEFIVHLNSKREERRLQRLRNCKYAKLLLQSLSLGEEVLGKGFTALDVL